VVVASRAERPLGRRPIGPPPPPVRGTVHIRADQCKGCQFCIEFCPKKILALSGDFNAKGFHYPVVVRDECVDCKLCTRLCPDYAIFSTSRVVPSASDGPAEIGGGRWRATGS
jgi:2-oxoglutarate ferredoxin oxidoreductase subunit delta